MVVILNNTARQYNLKTVSDGQRVTVRVIPGYNEVPKVIWKKFDDGKVVDKYVAELKKDKKLDWGKDVDNESFEKDDTIAKSKVKSTAIPKKKN